MPETREIVVPGARLSVETRGAGSPPLLLLHGFAGDRRLWDFVWDELGSQHRLLRYDLRGYGRSVALDDGEFRHSSDLAALLDALGIERCDLAGVSLGGSVALNFALDHPGRVRRLVLISPGMTAWEWSEDWRAAWSAVVAAARSEGIERARALWWEHPLFASTRAVPQAAAKLRETLWDYSGAVWAGRDREEAALPDLDRLPFLEPPTLLLTGAADLPDFRLIAQLIESAAPRLRRVDYAGAGHMLNLERPGDVAAQIRDFIA